MSAPAAPPSSTVPIASLGSEYVLGLRAVNCATGDLIDQDQLQAARKEDVLNVLSQLATKFRTRVGESLATIQQHSTSLEESTTTSLDALKAYTVAIRRTEPAPTAVPLLKRAIDIDPNFAIAHALLGLLYSGLGETLLGEESTSKAYQLRDHATDRDRFFISTIYDRQVTGNLEKEGETLRLWAQTYPRDPVAPGLTGGFFTAGTGQYDLMIEKARASIAISPDRGRSFLRRTSTLCGVTSAKVGQRMLSRRLSRRSHARPDYQDAASRTPTTSRF